MAPQGIAPTRANREPPAGAVVSAPAGASAPRERGILFSAPMVKALLAGTKGQTRRLVKPQPMTSAAGVYADRYNRSEQWAFWLPDNRMTEPRTWACPYGVVGDRLWVREAWCSGDRWTGEEHDPPQTIRYRADNGARTFRSDRSGDWFTPDMYAWSAPKKWKPGIHMFRWMSRITLEVTGVRVERLQDISEEDARAEGVEPDADCMTNRCRRPYFDRYMDLWDEINGTGSWKTNPFVWCVAFRMVDSAGGAT